MKHLKLLIGLLFVLVYSCSSSSDEPEQEYNGPWEIVYYEVYHGMHNNSIEFESWFNSHTEYFSAAQFLNVDGSKALIIDSPNGECFELNNYDKYYNGEIEWIEHIDKASEPEVKAIVSAFESMSIKNDRDKKFDIFTAYYKKVKE